MPKSTTPAARRKTRTWKEDIDDWRFEVTHPDGHGATGAGYPSEKEAKEAAKTVTFAKPEPSEAEGA